VRTRIACALALGLAACGGGGTDIDSTLVFADRTDIEIARLANAGSGSEMFAAQSQINQFGDTFDADPCPAIAVDGDTVTVTGGCTRLDGTTVVEGTATIVNPQGWDQLEWNPSIDTDYDVDLTFDYGGYVQSYVGVMSTSNDYLVMSSDIIVDQGGVQIRSDIKYVCSQASLSCSLSGSGIDMIGVGGARVSGTFHADTQTAEFTMRGVDVLTVTLDAGCVGWAISGTDRQVSCP
jgi:hypothetical protein